MTGAALSKLLETTPTHMEHTVMETIFELKHFFRKSGREREELCDICDNLLNNVSQELSNRGFDYQVNWLINLGVSLSDIKAALKDL